MSDAPFPEGRTLPAAQAARIDAVCDGFEAAWQTGQRPDLEEHLGETPEPARSVLLWELLRVEVYYRRQAGEEPLPSDYLTRFPTLHPQWVAGALAAGAASPTPPKAPATAPTRKRPGSTPAEPVVPGFEILGVLGRGGMGVVYQARQVKLNRLVALKMVLTGADAAPRELSRFRREAETVARLQHPNIVQIYEVGEQVGRPYFAMEFLDGGSLDKQLAGTPQPAAAAAELMETLARAVQYAHERGVIHRDLKPANVLLQGRNHETHETHEKKREEKTDSEAAQSGPQRDGSFSCVSWFLPKITDFGLAKLFRGSADGATVSGDILGTPSYMAPEQTEGKADATSPATDVYGLGAILYELLTGRPPFKAATALETLVQVRNDEPVSPGRLQPKSPRDLVTICMKCLEKDPRKRYATALALAEDLRRYRAGEPIAARPAGPVERLGRWARRKPLVAGLAAVLVVVVAASLAGLTTLWLRAEDNAARAETNLGQAQQQEQRANKNFRQAQQVVEQYLTTVADDPRLQQADLHDLRKQLLTMALPYYEDFVRQPGDQPKVERDRAHAYFRFARVRAALGETAQAIKHYEELAALVAPRAAAERAEPEYRSLLAMSHNNRGLLLQDLGQRTRAAAAYEAAQVLQEQLVAHFPAVGEYHLQLAHSHNNLGILRKSAGRWQEAETSYRKALAIQEKLVLDFPHIPAGHRALAKSHYNLGLLLDATRRGTEAEAAYRNALAIQEKLSAKQPTFLQGHHELSMTCTSLGLLLADDGRWKEAADVHTKALAIQEKLAARFPTLPRYRQARGLCYNHLGLALAATGPRAEAEAAYHKALAILESLAGDFPAIPAYRISLGGTYCNLGTLLKGQGSAEQALVWYARALRTLGSKLGPDAEDEKRRRFQSSAHWGRAQALTQLGRHAEAARDWQQASELDAGSNRLWLRCQRALALARAGDHVQAMAEVHAVAAEKSVAGGNLYELACACALASAATADAALTERHAAHAVVLLRQAHVAGFFKGAGRVERLKTDKQFDAVRSRADFQEILRELTTDKTPNEETDATPD